MYTLYLDESGDWGYPSFDKRSPILCLCGFILDDALYQTHAEPELAALKQRTFGRADVLLHRAEVNNRSGPFKILRDNRLGNFEQALSNFLQNLDYALIVVSVDKIDQYRTYGERPIDQFLPQDIYLLLFTFLMERFLAFLQERKSKGRVIAEAREATQNARVLREYAEMQLRGTQFYSAKDFRRWLLTWVEFRSKQDNIGGLQLADWVAYGFWRLLMSVAKGSPSSSWKSNLDWMVNKPKIWIGQRAPSAGQVGFKTWPRATGRDMLGMKLP